MRILYILTSLGIGGAESQVTALAARMAAKGHTVAFMVLKHSDEEWPTKLPVMRLNLPKTASGIWKGLRFAQQFITLFRPDLLHSHTFPANLFARLLRLRGPRPSPILVNTLHNVYEGGWHRMALYALTDPLADAVTAVSEAAASRFLRWHAVSPGKLSVLGNGIDTEVFAPIPGERKRTRARMAAGSAFIWLAVGRIAPAKDYANLLQAFRKLRAKQPGGRLWIAGEGDPDAIRELMLESNAGVEFLGLRRDIPELLCAADAYVLSSAWEGLPLALAEAMAMQKPVVATDVGGVRELIGEAGLLVPAKEPEALAAAMELVMLMPEMPRMRMAHAARARVESLYSLSAKAVAWEALYRRLNGDLDQEAAKAGVTP
jgi:glycosyltransferase involved in cell wall biosynthesis